MISTDCRLAGGLFHVGTGAEQSNARNARPGIGSALGSTFNPRRRTDVVQTPYRLRDGRPFLRAIGRSALPDTLKQVTAHHPTVCRDCRHT